jgi:hypothetical protein
MESKTGPGAAFAVDHPVTAHPQPVGSLQEHRTVLGIVPVVEGRFAIRWDSKSHHRHEVT